MNEEQWTVYINKASFLLMEIQRTGPGLPNFKIYYESIMNKSGTSSIKEFNEINQEVQK